MTARQFLESMASIQPKILILVYPAVTGRNPQNPLTITYGKENPFGLVAVDDGRNPLRADRPEWHRR